MLQLKPLDPAVPIFQQLQSEQSPVVLVNRYQLRDFSPCLRGEQFSDGAYLCVISNALINQETAVVPLVSSISS